MQIMCARGCGQTIDVSRDVVEDALAHGTAINIAHEVCPTIDMGVLEDASANEYQVLVIVNRKRPDDPHRKRLTRIGGTIRAESFMEGLPLILEQVEHATAKIVEMGEVIESDETDMPSQPR